jgi:hypothetical protein
MKARMERNLGFPGSGLKMDMAIEPLPHSDFLTKSFRWNILHRILDEVEWELRFYLDLPPKNISKKRKKIAGKRKKIATPRVSKEKYLTRNNFRNHHDRLRRLRNGIGVAQEQLQTSIKNSEKESQT